MASKASTYPSRKTHGSFVNRFQATDPRPETDALDGLSFDTEGLDVCMKHLLLLLGPAQTVDATQHLAKPLWQQRKRILQTWPFDVAPAGRKSAIEKVGGGGEISSQVHILRKPRRFSVFPFTVWNQASYSRLLLIDPVIRLILKRYDTTLRPEKLRPC